MPATAATLHSPGRIVRFAWLIGCAALLLTGIWFIPGSDASGSNALIVIEDASPNPTGLFPGTICYQLSRNSDDVVVTQGCLAIAAAISAPAGFDRGALYTLDVTVHDARCTLLDDPRVGNGVIPFRIRVACHALNEAQTDAADGIGPKSTDHPYVAAGASPIPWPIVTRP